MKQGRVVLVAAGTETRGNVSDSPVSRSHSHTHQVHAHYRYKPLSALFSPDAPPTPHGFTAFLFTFSSVLISVLINKLVRLDSKSLVT